MNTYYFLDKKNGGVFVVNAKIDDTAYKTLEFFTVTKRDDYVLLKKISCLEEGLMFSFIPQFK